MQVIKEVSAPKFYVDDLFPRPSYSYIATSRFYRSNELFRNYYLKYSIYLPLLVPDAAEFS
jgi:hypothetical protein